MIMIGLETNLLLVKADFIIKSLNYYLVGIGVDLPFEVNY
jgi:hypothetical protein